MKKIIFAVVVSLILLFAVIFVWQSVYLPKDERSKEEILFIIEPGQRVREIAFNLESRGLIKDDLTFKIYAALSDDGRNLKAGAYNLSPSMTIPEIVAKIGKGEIIKDQITIIEGWNLRDIGRFFEDRKMFQPEELFEMTCFTLYGYCQEPEKSRYMEDFRQDFDFLEDKPKNVGLEGYLFPDTYEIKKGEDLERIVRRMLQNFDKKLTPELREEIKKQGKTIFEIITMASLIEKEVRSLEDKKLVSGLLWRRMEIGMPLQVDATIAYFIGGEGWTFQEMRREIGRGIVIDSPYNTYKYRGLPLGPISNPGLKSIIAAVYPEDSNFLYYLSTPEGKTIFSETLTEHKIPKPKSLR